MYRKAFTIYNTSKISIKDKHFKFIKVDDLLKNIDFYKKSTGIMMGNIIIPENDIVLFILDNHIIIINETDISRFQLYFNKNKEKTAIYFLNSICQKIFNEMQNMKDQIMTTTTSQGFIQINQKNFIQELQKKICKCIIKKSQIRTINRRRKTNQSIDQKEIKFDLYDFIDLKKFIGSNVLSLRFNIKDQFLYVLKYFNLFDKDSKLRYEREISFYENHNGKNPFICKYYGKLSDKIQNLLIIIIEYIEGQTLDDFIKNYPLSIDQKIIIIIDILCAIEYLHLNDFMYRDLKSNNIMIDSKLNAILIDFDRLKKFDGKTLTADFGSSLFIPHEQGAGDYSFPADIYSLGKIIHLILTGQLNFQNPIPDKYSMLYYKFKFCLSENPEERPNISDILNITMLNCIYYLKNFKPFLDEIIIIRKNLFDYLISTTTTMANMKDEFYELSALVGYLYYDDELIKQDFKKAFDLLNISAGYNNSFALFLFGLIYSDGEYFPININKAISYFTQSAKQNNAYAQYFLGMIYYNGEYVPIDMNKAIYYLTLSAKQNNSDAQYMLGIIYYYDEYALVDINKAIYYLTLSAKQNNSDAQYVLGIIYSDGKYVPIDIDRALYYLNCSSNQNNKYSHCTLGVMYHEGIHVPFDINKALYYFGLSANQNNAEAQMYIGLIYLIDDNIPHDIDKALYYLSLSANQNNANSQMLIGLLYSMNTYVPFNINKAIQYLSISSNNNNKDAQFILGQIYYANELVPRNIPNAIKYLTLASNHIKSDAQFYLGQIFYEGIYIQQDINKAIHYFKKASCFNDQYAKNNLGVIYKNGDGEKKNIFNAIEYFKEAIRYANDPYAMFNLAKILYFGIDIKPNIEKAIELFNKLSQNNFFFARIFLLVLHINDKRSIISKILKIIDEKLFFDIKEKTNKNVITFLKELDLIYGVNHDLFFSNEMKKKFNMSDINYIISEISKFLTQNYNFFEYTIFLTKIIDEYKILKNKLSIFNKDEKKQTPDLRRCIDENFYKGFYNI